MKSKSRYLPAESSASSRLSKSDLTRLASLKTKKGRKKEGLFLAEGVRLLEDALKHHCLPEILYLYPPDINERAQALVESFRSKKVPTETISSRDFHRLVETKSPQGLLGVFQIPSQDFRFHVANQAQRILVVEHINDPGNLGALLRSALGFGFDLILLVGDCVEPFNSKVVRSTAGAIFASRMMNCNIEELRSLTEGDAGGARFRLLVTDIDGVPEDEWLAGWTTTDSDGKDIVPGLAVAVGAESVGASVELRELAHKKIRITQSPALESLNAGIAGSIVMHHVYLNSCLHDSSKKR